MRISDWSSDVCSSDLLDVNLDGRFGDVEPAGDDLVCVTCYKAPENFDFPVGQVDIELAGVQRPCAVAPDRIGKRLDDLRGDDLLAMGDQPERAAEWLARNGLYKIAVDSGPKGVGDVFNLKLIGHQHDVRLWKLAVKITA